MYRKRKKIIFCLFIMALLAILFFSLVGGKILYPYLYKHTIEEYAAAYGVDPMLIIAVIREESRYNPRTSSHKGAVGLMQLMPNTARDIAQNLKEDYEQVNLLNPKDNIRYGTWYLAALSKEFDGNIMLTLAAYNAGSGRVNQWLKDSTISVYPYGIEDIPFKETREYVVKVLDSYRKYSELYGK